MIKSTGVDGTMSGYGPLLDPSIFAPYDIPINKIIEDYLIIAKKHENKLIDIQRHLGWLLKRYITSPALKSDLFTCKNLKEIQEFLNKTGYDISIDYNSVDKISYPDEQLIGKNRLKRKLKKETKRQEKIAKDKYKIELTDNILIDTILE